MVFAEKREPQGAFFIQQNTRGFAMKLAWTVGTLALVWVSLSGCAGAYDFRSEDRPTYDQMVSPDELVAHRSQGGAVLDVRLREDFDGDPVLIPGAVYKDPERIQEWADQMSPIDGPVIVYCVRGKWVSQKAATYLESRGFEVFSLDGGIEAWKADERQTIAPD